MFEDTPLVIFNHLLYLRLSSLRCVQFDIVRQIRGPSCVHNKLISYSLDNNYIADNLSVNSAKLWVQYFIISNVLCERQDFGFTTEVFAFSPRREGVKRNGGGRNDGMEREICR